MESTIDLESLGCVIREIGSSVHSSTRVKDVAQMVLRKIVDFTDAKGASLLIIDLNHRQLDLEFSHRHYQIFTR
jgi:hypothetical protein